MGGPSGLPVISSDITILTVDSNNDGTIIPAVIIRQSDYPFRLLHIANNGMLTLQDLVLREGVLYHHNGAGLLNNGTTIMENVLLRVNYTGRNGAGIYNKGDLSLLDGTAVNDNFAERLGGGIFNHGDGVINGVECALMANSTPRFAGALYNLGDVSLDDCTVFGNFSNRNGGAIFNRGMLSISNSTMSENGTEWNGAAIYHRGSDLNITNTAFDENFAERSGGAIFIHRNTQATISDSFFVANSSMRQGGAIYVNRDTVLNALSKCVHGKLRQPQRWGALCQPCFRSSK